MRKSLLTKLSGAALALVLSAGVAESQATTRKTGGDPAARREAMKERREEMKERRDDRKERIEALTPAQREAAKEHMKAYQEQRKLVLEKVKAGTIDRKTAAEQLKAWREAHRPAKP